MGDFGSWEEERTIMAPALEPLFRALSDDIANQQYKRAIEVCDKILAQVPNDEDALKCKCLCYIHLNQFQEAIKFLDANPSLSMEQEKAYCLYKERKHDEALRIIQQIGNLSVAGSHLKAQTHYRLGDFDQVLNCYQSMEQTPEVLVNITATHGANKQFNESIKQLLVNDQALDSSHELCFNLACILIARGDIGTAEKLLERAQRVCKETLTAQEFSEEEITDELAAIRVQLGYIYQLTDRTDAAMEIYEDVLKAKPSEDAVVAVAHNNLSLGGKNKSLFSIERDLFTASAVDQNKLTDEQKKAIGFNRAIVYLKMGKTPKSKEILEQLQKEFPDSSLPTLLESALLMKEKQTDEAIKLLTGKGKDLQSRLSLAQLLLKSGKVKECVETLGSLEPDTLHQPGVVASRVKLFLQLDSADKANQAIDDAVAYWESKQATENLITIMTAGSEFKLQSGQYEKAADFYSRLLKLDPSNKLVYIPNLIIALSYFDPAQAKTYAKGLPEISYNAASFDLDALENTGTFRSSKQSAVSNASGDAQMVERKKKTKKKKKKRLPKNFDPNVPPDPERWKPRKERSNYKKRRGKMRGRHQGEAASGVDTKKEPVAAKPATAQKPAVQKPKKSKRGRRR